MVTRERPKGRSLLLRQGSAGKLSNEVRRGGDTTLAHHFGVTDSSNPGSASVKNRTGHITTLNQLGQPA